MAKPESFEVTEYESEPLDVCSVVNQIVQEQVRESPTHGVLVSFAGGQMTLKYHCYEMHLPSRMKQVESSADDVFRETVSRLKKEFKKRTRKALSLRETKDRAGHTVQKVSLNERYYAIFWRVYSLDLG